MNTTKLLNTRIRVEKRENNDLYFVPEVLVLRNELDWEDQQFFQRKCGGYSNPEYARETQLYLDFFGKNVEWYIIKKSKSYYRKWYQSFNGHRSGTTLEKTGYKTLKTARDVLNQFKVKYKNEF